MGAQLAKEDFEWVYTDEPHATRRKELLAKYGSKIRPLMAPNYRTAYQVVGMVVVQFFLAYVMRNASFFRLFILAYTIGGTLHSLLAIAIHEISHNTVFGNFKRWPNLTLGLVANLPMIFPATASTKKYHPLHYRYQGDEELDSDLPSEFEAKLFNTMLGKFVWVSTQMVFHGLRPLFIHALPVTSIEIVNNIIQLLTAFFMVVAISWKSLLYLIASSALGHSIHVMGLQFISGHYIVAPGQETYSYYGPLNLIAFNIGYHNEHHDFPSIPGSNLPKLHDIAPEYYDTLCRREAWSKLMIDFLLDSNLSLFHRVKRRYNIKNTENDYSEN